MARIYVSSSYTDLKVHRQSVYKVLRQMGHDVIAMEDYSATEKRLTDKCLSDVSAADVYVGIFAWRYGYIPNGEARSISELEFRVAVKSEIPMLLFLVADDTHGHQCGLTKINPAAPARMLRP